MECLVDYLKDNFPVAKIPQVETQTSKRLVALVSSPDLCTVSIPTIVDDEELERAPAVNMNTTPVKM